MVPKELKTYVGAMKVELMNIFEKKLSAQNDTFCTKIAEMETNLWSRMKELVTEQCSTYFSETQATVNGLELAAQWQNTATNEINDKINNSILVNSQIASNVDCLHEMVNANSSEIKASSIEVNNLGQYNRRNNLMVDNIEQTKDEDVEKKVLEVFNAIDGVVVEPSDISVAHRMPEKENSKVPAVIVRFTTRKKRNEVYYKKKEVSKIRKSSLSFNANPREIFISENLTVTNNEIFYEARQMKRRGLVKFAWTKHGKVHVRKYVNSKAFPIDTLQDLNRFM